MVSKRANTFVNKCYLDQETSSYLMSADMSGCSTRQGRRERFLEWKTFVRVCFGVIKVQNHKQRHSFMTILCVIKSSNHNDKHRRSFRNIWQVWIVEVLNKAYHLSCTWRLQFDFKRTNQGGVNYIITPVAVSATYKHEHIFILYTLANGTGRDCELW